MRPSNLDASAGALEAVERIVAQLRAVWPEVRKTLRADSDFCRDALLPRCASAAMRFCRDALMTWCETHAVDYVFGLAKHARLIALIADALATAAATCTETTQPARVFAERTYQTLDSWTCPRRVVAKAEQLTPATADGAGTSNLRFIVTSRTMRDVDARTLYEDVDCARGERENRITEQQLMRFADRTSAATMRTNQLRLYFPSVAYVLLAALRRLGLAGTALARAQCTTIRLTLLKIAARIRVTVRKVWRALASGCPHLRCSRRCTRICANVNATALSNGTLTCSTRVGSRGDRISATTPSSGAPRADACRRNGHSAPSEHRHAHHRRRRDADTLIKASIHPSAHPW